jgi:hypothetical protein
MREDGFSLRGEAGSNFQEIATYVDIPLNEDPDSRVQIK